jgi:hypothetical protein
MIEFSAPIEDLKYDPVSKKYRVVGSSGINNKKSSNSLTGKPDSNSSSVTFKIKPKNRTSRRNLIEKKGLHVDFIVK